MPAPLPEGIERTRSLPVRRVLGETLALAERTGGIVDHAGSRGLMANLRAQQDGGWVTATLAEIRNRADLVLSHRTADDAFDVFGVHGLGGIIVPFIGIKLIDVLVNLLPIF